MKKVLILTYYWPPSGGSGVQRWMYFCKYLSDFGYEPIVVSVDEKFASYKNVDSGLLEMVKDVEVHRTKSIEPLRLYSLMTSGHPGKGLPQGDIKKDKKGVLNRLSIFVRGNFFIPDARVGWNRFALGKARELVVQNSIETVITTGPPHSTHLVGYRLKQEFPLRWVADFRDPWVEIFYNKDFNRSGFAARKDARLEKKVLNKADLVLTVGAKLKELLENKGIDKNKVRYIYNGYDSFAMDRIIPDLHEHFQITFIGLLTKLQPYRAFIEAMKIFIGQFPDPNIRLVFAGNVQEEILGEFESELPGIAIDVHGYVKHHAAMKLMKESQLLLNFLAEMEQSEILISGKQMEYIATGNPILCVGNTAGEAALVLQEVNNAGMFEKHQVGEIALFVGTMYGKWLNGDNIRTDSDGATIADKSRYETTKQLASLLNSM